MTNHKIKISHEVPIAFLDRSKEFNDFDYALVHLFEEEPDYLKYYENNIKERNMYLDNSVFELGHYFDIKKFKNWCNHFCDINEDNFHYIVPDSLGNKDETIRLFNEFNLERGKKIGVIQGSSKEELIECFEYMKGKCEIIAIPFYNPCYLEGFGFNDDFKLMNGRIDLIKTLKERGLLNNVKIHLLGCALPQEFKSYKDIKEIYSIDTSSPIVHGIVNIKYADHGLEEKFKQKLVDFIHEKDFNDVIDYNIKKFRDFIE